MNLMKQLSGSYLARMWRIVTSVCAAGILISGCAGYTQKMSGTVQSLDSGSVDQALQKLEQANNRKEKDLLYYLEKGELLRVKGAFPESRATLLLADAKIRAWEDQVRKDPRALLGDLGSVVVNDTTRRYDGRDYEKVFVSVRLCLDHLALGDWDAARVEIKKMHEREAVIAEFRAKEMEAAKAKANKEGLKATSFQDLNGYPIATLNDPAVRGLANSYESAFANYLAGFVYESLGDTSLAAAGYRKAAEMKPNDVEVARGLAGLDSRSAVLKKDGLVDVLFVIETGSAPQIDSQSIPLVVPVPSRYGLSTATTAMSWPVIRPLNVNMQPTSIAVNDQQVPLSMLTNVDLMARKALANEMPGIIVRSSVRAITRAATQAAAQEVADQNAGQLGVFGALLKLGTGIGALVTEKADERTWRTLPAFYSIGRLSLPPGSYSVSIPGAMNTQPISVQVGGAHAVVALRSYGRAVSIAQSPVTASVASR